VRFGCSLKEVNQCTPGMVCMWASWYGHHRKIMVIVDPIDPLMKLFLQLIDLVETICCSGSSHTAQSGTWMA